MKIDFDVLADRRKSNSEKWNLSLLGPGNPDDVLPMWVADMDFRSPPAVQQALMESVKHGVFGYTYVTESYLEAVTGWQQRRHNWNIKPEWILQTAGVVAALSQIIQAFTDAGDGVLIQTPVYGRFFKTPLTNGRRVIEAPLTEGNGVYHFDPHIFEQVIQAEKPKIFILCNPHNPIGKVWTAGELREIGEICLKHNVLVVSDEVHQDLVFGEGLAHTVYANLGEDYLNNSIVCTSPSKTFNLAGLQVSNIIIANRNLRCRLQNEMDRNGNHSVNTLGMVACEAAYTHGEEWLNSLIDYISGNHKVFSAEVERLEPSVRAFKSDCLYLAWLDCRGLNVSGKELDQRMLKAGLWLDSGEKFGSNGKGFMRVNLGCSKSVVLEAMLRLGKAVNY